MKFSANLALFPGEKYLTNKYALFRFLTSLTLIIFPSDKNRKRSSQTQNRDGREGNDYSRRGSLKFCALEFYYSH